MTAPLMIASDDYSRSRRSASRLSVLRSEYVVYYCRRVVAPRPDSSCSLRWRLTRLPGPGHSPVPEGAIRAHVAATTSRHRPNVFPFAHVSFDFGRARARTVLAADLLCARRSKHLGRSDRSRPSQVLPSASHVNYSKERPKIIDDQPLQVNGRVNAQRFDNFERRVRFTEAQDLPLPSGILNNSGK